MFKKEIITKIIVGLWILISFLYIGYNVADKFLNNLVSKAYSVGANDAINKILEKTEEKKCYPIKVSSKEKKVSLIDVECLKKPQNQEESAPK